MNNYKTIIIGTEKVIQPSSSWWGSGDGVFVVSAYSDNSKVTDTQITEKALYYVESCSIINPQTGCANDLDPFKNTVDFVPDTLYNDISRFGLTDSSAAEFRNTFSGYNLEGSEFAVALTAHISEKIGYNPWVIIHSEEKKLIEFCADRGWTFTVLSRGGRIMSHVITCKNSLVI